jgi:crossover junction endodeoxyribonuclease RuvC
LQRATRILGIDPGLTHTGWGLIESAGSHLRYIAAGAISTLAGDELSARLVLIHNGLSHLIGEWQPDEAAVEHTYVNKNPAAALKLGQARGVALLAPALAGLPVAEYQAMEVKRAVVGTGFDRGFQHGVGICDICAEAQGADAVELEGHRLAHGAAGLAEHGAQIAGRAVAVVGQRLDDDGHPARATPLIADFIIILARACALGLLDGAVHHILGHVRQPRRDQCGAQARVMVRVGQALLGCHGDFAPDLGEGPGALGVLPALAVHDVLELRMASHDDFRDWLKKRGIAPGGGFRHHAGHEPTCRHQHRPTRIPL